MKQSTTRGDDDPEIKQLRDNQRKLAAALQTLFGLLEEYAPLWYTEEHPDKAVAALACIESRRP
jgi:hypothetical protein